MAPINFLRVVITVAASVLWINSFAQKTKEQLIAEAKQHVLQQRYSQARNIAFQILTKNPEYNEASLLIAQTYGWENNFDSARLILEPVLRRNPHHYEALAILAFVETADKNPYKAVEYANTLYRYDSSSYDNNVRKIKAELQAGMFEQAYESWRKSNLRFPRYDEIKELHGQLMLLRKANNDSLLKEAKNLIELQKIREAKDLALKIYQSDTTYYDAAVLAARTYSWIGAYDSARMLLDRVMAVYPQHYQAMTVYADLELWNDRPEKSLDYANRLLEYDTTIIDNIMRKARAQKALKNYTDALNTLDKAKKINPTDAEILRMYAELQELKLRNRVRADYQYTIFYPQFKEWKFGSIEYQRIENECTYIGRLNYADRFNLSSVQGEVDLYPQFSKKNYGFFNVGLSDGVLFPNLKLGAEYFHVFPLGIEASVGAKGLFYQRNFVPVFTAQIGQYYKSFWYSYRPSAVMQKEFETLETFWSHQIIVRRFFNHRDQFVSLIGGFGKLPFSQLALQELQRLNSKRIGVEGFLRIGNNFIVGANYFYEHEEYETKKYRNRYTAGIALIRKF